MSLFILPWAVFWAVMPLFPDFGVYISLVVTASMPLFYFKWNPTVYDTISVFLVVIFNIFVVLGLPLSFTVTISFVVFGLIWITSLFTRVPLCAWYSSKAWGYEEAFKDPIFMLTNKIICACWGIFYIASAY